MKNEKQDKKWIELKKLLGDCSSCIHKLECKSLQDYVQSMLNGEYKFQCPILIEADEGMCIFIRNVKNENKNIRI